MKKYSIFYIEAVKIIQSNSEIMRLLYTVSTYDGHLAYYLAAFTEVVARRGWNSPSSSGSSAGRKPAALTGSPSPLSSLGRSSCERDDPPRANVLRRNSFGVLYRAALFNASKQSPSPLFHDTQ